ncbi:MAG TPA: tRNA uridine-5-carboxymethylaminomethyl(34) synthesis enzyme MnmG [Phycisphaerales bacterium]|nr:tRNA uridine-5-carboxymethylaminomethyl(34) synthesis enzyme MnmG [Phycisphaerales bacterium]
MSQKKYDIIVVGGGHAGAEAAWAASRLGAQTLLLTMRRDTIAKMSCNPAIGGLAKGQIVREIDAMGGLMGLATDAAGIQFRLLNRSKGPAVQSPRAQTDKYQYAAYIRQQLESTDNLTLAEHTAAEVLTRNGAVCGVRCEDGTEFAASAVILTTGTFLRGVMHMGREQWPGGRLGEPAGNALSDCLRRLGLMVKRLKTGTPVRLDGATLDYDKTDIQPGDADPQPFSFMNDRIDRPQVPCWITWTNPAIHDLLRANLHLAPMYTGQIQSVGPRYCPSIETKIMRFADKTRHQVFLEPEDQNVTTIYCNGISTSYPKEIQDQMLRLMEGTQRARIVHYAYAIEYDYCPATQLKPNLETRTLAGLFLAGQINGTSGYEEAAGQGLLAGVNAVHKLAGKEPLVLGRDQAYLGVLVDDLLTREIDEPYRMFTSRAEYRLTLRSDNADARLAPIGRQIGLVDESRWQRFCAKQQAIEQLQSYLKQTRIGGKSLWEWIKQPTHPLSEDLTNNDNIAKMGLPREVIQAAAIACKYEGYLARQDKQIAAFRNLEHIKLPVDLDYHRIPHLRFEAREKLAAFRPFTLGQASRLGGITPADITIIQIHLKKTKSRLSYESTAYET